MRTIVFSLLILTSALSHAAQAASSSYVSYDYVVHEAIPSSAHTDALKQSIIHSHVDALLHETLSHVKKTWALSDYESLQTIVSALSVAAFEVIITSETYTYLSPGQQRLSLAFTIREDTSFTRQLLESRVADDIRALRSTAAAQKHAMIFKLLDR